MFMESDWNKSQMHHDASVTECIFANAFTTALVVPVWFNLWSYIKKCFLCTPLTLPEGTWK